MEPMVNSNTKVNWFVIQLNWLGEWTEREFPVFRKGNILLESDIVRNLDGSLILFHPANNAMKELNGCIAPVTKLSGPGLGLLSRKAFEKLKTLVYTILDRQEVVELLIISKL